MFSIYADTFDACFTVSVLSGAWLRIVGSSGDCEDVVILPIRDPSDLEAFADELKDMARQWREWKDKQ